MKTRFQPGLVDISQRDDDQCNMILETCVENYAKSNYSSDCYPDMQMEFKNLIKLPREIYDPGFGKAHQRQSSPDVPVWEDSEVEDGTSTLEQIASSLLEVDGKSENKTKELGLDHEEFGDQNDESGT